MAGWSEGTKHVAFKIRKN